MRCTSCGSNDIENDGSLSYCNTCGLVLEESGIVSELVFGETSGGAAILQGSYVSADKGRISMSGPYKRGNGMESREQTAENGRRRILQMATALRLPERYQESAQRYYNLAITNNFCKGRKTANVVAVCLYVVCRMEKSSHMLIDFSDLLQINVFILGSTFLKFVHTLHLSLPLIDPSLYISRFATMMDLGDHTQRVAQDAVRLVQRMDRDWIHTGRRPAGICGACLLIAARLNGFRRTQREIITIVKVAEVTLKKRLDEFKQTPSSQLSVRDFRSVWLEEEWDPPAFIAARKKHMRVVSEPAKAESNGKRRRVRFRDDADEDDDEVEEEDETGAGEEDEGEKDQANDMFRVDKVLSEDAMAMVVTQDSVVEGSSSANPLATGEDPALEAEMESVMRDVRVQETADLMGREREAEKAREVIEEAVSLSDVDDEEIESVLLTEEEVRVKTQVWYEFNREYLEEQARRRRREQEDRRNGVHRNKGKRKPKRPPSGQASTPAEAARQMLLAKKVSRKIDYSKLEALFETPDGVLELKTNSRLATPSTPSPHGSTATGVLSPPNALQALLQEGARFPYQDTGYETDDGYEIVDETGVEVGVKVKRPRVQVAKAPIKVVTEVEEDADGGLDERILEARRALGYEDEEGGDEYDEYNEDD